MRNTSIIFISLILAFVISLFPFNLNPNSHKLLSLMVIIFSWWLLTDIPVGVTALCAGLGLCLLGIATPTEAFAPFAHPLIFLFMGGFFMGKAMQVHKVDRAIALKMINLKFVQGNFQRVMLSLCLVSLFLSMWISNTAAIAILLPIGLDMASSKSLKMTPAHQGYFLLALAYSATLGGLLTPIGSPPNLISMAFLEKITGQIPTFFEWFTFSFPVVLISFVVLFKLVSKQLKDYKDFKFDIEKVDFKMKQLIVLALIFLAITLWLLPGILKTTYGADHIYTQWIQNHFSESIVALFIGCLFFLIPMKNSKPLLSWDQGKDIDWNTLLLFGGGLTMGTQMFESGLSQELGSLFTNWLGGAPIIVFCLVLLLFTQFFTEIASNTASANLLIPIFIPIFVNLGFDAMGITFAVAIACGLAFMLPIATPPNAIVFASQKVPIKLMAKFGLIMNLVCGLFLIARTIITL